MCSDTKATLCSISSTANVSLSCVPGYAVEAGLCKVCPDNCLTCTPGTNSTFVCTIGGCKRGFYQFGTSTKCVSCFNGCPVCGSDPAVCLSCGDGKFLSSRGTCISCSNNCLKCDASSCSICNPGYLLYNSACYSPPVSNCLAYTNLTCTQCSQNYILEGNGTKCTPNISCNTSSSCTFCDLNQYLSLTNQCLVCPVIANCQYCNPAKSQQNSCLQCNSGYYLNGGNCVLCSSAQAGCSACSSAQVCTTAQDGYFISVDYSGSSGIVQLCSGYCSKCSQSSLSCTECKSGYTL